MIAIKEGADLDLSCPTVVHNEDMIISWTCDDEPASLLSSRIHVTNAGKLRISAAKPGDACNYRCEAADGFGTLSVVIKVIIVDKRSMEQLGSRHRPGQPPSPGQPGAVKRVESDPVLVGQQQPGGQLEIQLQPSSLEVPKNRSFSLECSVRHAQHLGAPQIIWLKEFTGPKPESLSEAHEQNLVKIDDVYYHSLNWPRSMSYSKHQLGANSALLVRQSSHVHSGRYICFAGYPPATLQASLSLLPSSTAKNNSASNNEPPRRPWYLPQTGAQYNLSVASIKVLDDAEGQQSARNSHLAQLGRIASLPGASSGPSDHKLKELLLGLIANNSWIRNLSLVLLFASSCLYVTKYIYVRHQKRRAQLSAQAATDRLDQQNSNSGTTSTAATTITATTSATATALDADTEARTPRLGRLQV